MKKILSYLISTIIFNTAIAGILTLLMPGALFWHNFIYSQCIGLSVLTLSVGAIAYVKGNLLRWVVRILTLPLGVAVGMTLAFAFSGVGSWGDQYTWLTMTIGLFFSLIGGITLLLSERIDMEVEQRKLIKSESARREIEANLKLLQAQIEPHFLFNTLANVGGLIDNDPALAKKLLERLNDWLRVALARARSDGAVLGDELDMLENYLQILKVRFGDRLRWHIGVSGSARDASFPPMLLQPLVENAVRHGIEPKIGGGEIVVLARIESGKLYCEVRDDGVGIRGEDNGGAGLVNVRERLTTLFGEQGCLTLHNGVHGGTVATLELPAKN